MKILSRATALLSTPGPSAALEIAADRVCGVTVAGGSSTVTITGQASEGLPPGALVPGVATANVIDHAAVGAAVRAVLDRLPRRPVRVGLVVPDSAAKVSLVPLESVPRRESDLDSMIRWQVRKAVPFSLDDAQVSYSVGTRLAEGGREYVVAVIRRDIAEEYEGLCTQAGLRPGIVDLATFSLINAGLTRRPVGRDEDWLLVHAAAGYHSVGIVRGDVLVFFRNRVGEGDLSDLVHQTAMYYEDRLGGSGITKVLLAGSADGEVADNVTRSLAARLGAPVEAVSASARLGSDVEPGTLTSLAAPIGLLLREQLAAA